MSQNVADSLNFTNRLSNHKTTTTTPTVAPVTTTTTTTAAESKSVDLTKPILIKSHTSAYQLHDLATLEELQSYANINKALMPPLEQNQHKVNNTCAHHQNHHQAQQQNQHKSHHNQHQHHHLHHHHHHHHHQHHQQKNLNQQQEQISTKNNNKLQYHYYHQQHHNLHHNQQQQQQQQYLPQNKSLPCLDVFRSASVNSTTSSTRTTKPHFGSATISVAATKRRSRSASKTRRNSSYHSYDDLDAAATTAERRVVSSLKYLCACTGATLRNLSKKTKDLHAKNYLNTYTKPTWRLWGEEHEKNAIFTVYLKKVRYHRPTPTASNDSDDEISHLEWETVRVRFVKAATLARLVEALATDDGELESTFINVFLSTYRTFSTPKEVLSLLIKRYDTLHDKHVEEIEQHQQQQQQQQSNGDGDSSYDPLTSIHEQHKKTLVSALHVWLDGFPEDWHEDNLQQILAFAGKRLKRSELHIKVLNRLERLLRQQVYGTGNGGGVPGEHHNGSLPPWLHAGGGGLSGAQSVILNGGTINGIGIGLLQAQYGGLSSLGGNANYELSEQFAGLCLAPAFRGPTHFLQAFRFPHIPVRHFAEQLTRMDSELFKRLIPHQCLGATWARRDKSGSETVVATINQFNAVLFRVISSILIEPRLKPQDRALNIATWIDIAQELRLLKNFSSLKAIISGLQSNSIYRLSKIWEVLPKEKMEIFTELARIFSEDNNAWTQREVLMREGTAKFADTVGEQDRHLQKIIQKQSTQTSHGTIPYLGTFLTDLTMIHAAIPDTLGEEQQLINFDKKRKEFEVLAQIKLLQGAANTYNLRDDPIFDHWFASMLVLTEREAHTLSCQLEPQPPAPRKSTASTNTSLTTSQMTASSSNSIGGHRKTDSIASNSSSGAGSQFYCELNSSLTGSHYSSRHNSLDRDAPNASLMSASSSVSNLSLDSSNSGGQKSNSNHSKMTHSHSTNGVRSALTENGSPLINAQLVQPPGSTQSQAPNFYIIRVTYETDNIELDGIVLYKSIMLGNNERTPQVIRNAMLKLGLEDDPDRYTLAQVLPDKELVMPKNANVYYAVNTNYNLNFILRPRKDGNSSTTGS